MTDRRGYTLVETMVVITTSGMLAVLGVTTVSRLIQVERSGTRDVAESTVLRQLSLRFRADVHAARDAGLPDALPDRNPRASVDLREPGNRSVTWSLDAGWFAASGGELLVTTTPRPGSCFDSTVPVPRSGFSGSRGRAPPQS